VRTLYKWWATLVFAAVIVQVGFAGYGAFYSAHKLDDDGATIDDDGFFHGFRFHAAFGYIVVLLGLILLLIGLIAGIGRWRLGRQGVLFGLLILQVLLAWTGFGSPAVGFFHPVNALAIFALSGWIVLDEWRRERIVEGAVATA
jgi:predicted cobalt transporter CbtA